MLMVLSVAILVPTSIAAGSGVPHMTFGSNFPSCEYSQTETKDNIALICTCFLPPLLQLCHLPHYASSNTDTNE